MKSCFNVLSTEEKTRIHERSLAILGATGVRVCNQRARQHLADAGAAVKKGSDVVRFPAPVVEKALATTPRRFRLGARRPGWDLDMNAGGCTLLMSGSGTHALDRRAGCIRDATFDDWLQATRLSDALDDFGIYWRSVDAVDRPEGAAGFVDQWIHLFRHFSKHMQDSVNTPQEAVWLLEMLQVVFGGKEKLRQKKPFSFVLCPQSPLVIDDVFTEAYLALAGWGIPVAVMPMPLLGATAPASLAATVITANCEILAALCLIQSIEPGVPVIYAPVSAVMDPRTGNVKSGSAESGLISAASIEMARYYQLPAETSGLGTGRYAPGIQTAVEKAVSTTTPLLAWPDVLVGAGLLGGAMILSLEQILIDVEVYRMSRRLHQGVAGGAEQMMDSAFAETPPGGHFVDHPSSLKAVRGDTLYISRLERFESLEEWETMGRPDMLDNAREAVDRILADHQPLPLDAAVLRELDILRVRAGEKG